MHVAEKAAEEHEYKATVLEIAIHQRIVASYYNSNAPLAVVQNCPCKWCKESRKNGAR